MGMMKAVMMEKPKMFRKRFVPEEIKSLEKDEILYMDDHLIVTKWDTFKPKEEFVSGISYTFVNEGYKISKFMDSDGNLVYYYCDIIHSDYFPEENRWVFTDLLADVKIYPDGKTEVVDLGEVSEAFENGIIDEKIVMELLKKLDQLLHLIYSGRWRELTKEYF